jgi:hypothetical protein
MTEAKILDESVVFRDERGKRTTLTRQFVESVWLTLVDGPYAGAKVEMPDCAGDFILRDPPMDIEEFQDADGAWQFRRHPSPYSKADGAVVYSRPEGSPDAHFVEIRLSPTDESEDGDLVCESPYLKNAAVVNAEEDLARH